MSEAMSGRFRVAVLISGRGSNLGSLIDAADRGAFAVVGTLSNRPGAPGLALAEGADIATRTVDHRRFPDRASFDLALAAAIEDLRPDLVVLAGFMRILGDDFVGRFEGRIINIHPSLLPHYPGLDTHRRALEAGDAWHGATTHYVTAVLDGGPAIARTRLAIREGDTPESLAARLLPLEHRLMVKTVDLIARGAVQYRHGQVHYRGRPLDAPLEPFDPES